MDRDFNQLPMTGWYPGHMLKAGRAMQESLKLIDLDVVLLHELDQLVVECFVGLHKGGRSDLE